MCPMLKIEKKWKSLHPTVQYFILVVFLLFYLLYSRVRQYIHNFRFFYIFIIMQARLLPKVLKQANFCISLQNLRAEIELCANILALHCDNIVKNRELIFCMKVPQSKFFKAKFDNTPWKAYWFWTIAPQNPIFSFFASVPKNPKDINNLKNKGQIWNQHYQISLK